MTSRMTEAHYGTAPRVARGYQLTIHEMDKTINPAGVEASMRLEYGTLDHLSRAAFSREIETAKECERQRPGFMRSLTCATIWTTSART